MSQTSAEIAKLKEIGLCLEKLANYLAGRQASSDPKELLNHLLEVKRILGNLNNSVSFMACLLAKDYLSLAHSGFEFDAAKKPQGANGLDIDEKFDKKRVVAEIKTTNPYQKNDFG